MRIVRGQMLAALVLCITGFISVFRQILIIPSSTAGYNNRNMAYNHIANGQSPDISRLSAQHYMLDATLKRKYTTSHQKLRSNFSLFLNEETGSDGDNDVQHRGILRVGTEKLGQWPKIRFFPENETFRIDQTDARVRGTIYAKFVDDKRVLVHVNETIIPSFVSSVNGDDPDQSTFSNNYTGQRDSLCSLLLNMTRRESLDEYPPRGIPPVVLSVEALCNEMNQQERGQGRLALSILGLRLASAVGKVDLQFRCNTTSSSIASMVRNNRFLEEKASKLRWIFPWFMNFQPSPSWNASWPYSGIQPNQTEICPSEESNQHTFLPVDRMALQVRNTIQRMATTLMGSHVREHRSHPLVPLDAKPWISDTTMDDLVIYLPCQEDAVEGVAPSKSTGLVHFGEYLSLIHQSVKSIGIIVQRATGEDLWCHKAGPYLVEFLRLAFQDSSVVVSLYDNDPLPLQYARVAMAKQSFGSYSIFPMLAIMGTFGEGYYLQHQQQNQSTVALNVASGIFDKASGYDGFGNLHPWRASRVLSAEALRSMTWNDVHSWLDGSNETI